MQAEFNNLQSDWLNQAEALSNNEAAQVNGGNDLVALSNAISSEIQKNNIAFEQATLKVKSDRDLSKRLQ